MINLETLKEDIVKIALTQPALLEKNIDLFSPEFFNADFKVYVGIIRELYFEREEINDLSFISNLRKKDSQLTKKAFEMLTTSIENPYSSFHQLLVIQLQRWAAEEAVKIGRELSKNLYEVGADSFQTISNAKTKLENLIELKAIQPTRNVSQISKELLEKLRNGKRNGFSTGLAKLDKLIGGWIGGKLTIIGGRPGMGKSILAVFFAYWAAVQNKKVLFFSLEMTEDEIMGRLFSLHVRNKENKKVQYSHIEKYVVNEAEMKILETAQVDFSHLNILIDDTAGIDIDTLVSKTVVENSKNGVDIIFVDYIGLVSNKGSFGRQDQKIADITQKLKNLAKMVDAPVIALSQLNRKVEDRPDKMPILADFRDSGAVEQDADIVMFPFRPEYYGITQDMSGNSTKGKMQIGVEKHRGGGVISLHCNSPISFEIELATNYIFEQDSFFDAPAIEKQVPF